MKRKRFKLKAYSAKKNMFDAKILKNNQRLILLTFIFIVGLILGAACVKNPNEITLAKIKELIDSFYLKKAAQSILVNFGSYYLSDLIFICIAAVFALCIIGEPIIWLLPLIRGLGIGITTGYLYKSFNTNGMIYSILFVIIPACISVSLLIICCKENILSQKELRKKLKAQGNENSNQFIKLFALRNLILAAFTTVSSLTASLLVYFFSGKITL
ncbi:MAG TPA: hypothetical protein DCR23_06380 [Ruminococcaceae bacterium]|nr:hypothetical protein [Oscillospiraceae bacterium]